MAAIELNSLSKRSQCTLFCCVSLGYLVSAEIGHSLSFPGRFATFWLPAGLALAAYLAVPPQYWAILLLATFAANVASDVWLHQKSVFVSIGFWIANTTETLCAVALIRRFDSPARILQTVRSTLMFALFACVFSTAVGATLGATVVWLAFGENYATTWQIWWSGDFIGMLVTFPFVWVMLDAYQKWNSQREPFAELLQPISVGIFVGLLIALSTVTHYTFGLQQQRLAYIVFPFLLWLVMKFKLAGAACGLFALALITVGNTAAGRGLFGAIQELPTRAFVLQIFLFVSATTFLTLAATVQERTDAEHQLRMSQFTIDKASDAVFWIRHDGSFSYVNEKASEYYGCSAEELLTLTIADINPNYPLDEWASHWEESKQQGSMRFETVYQRKDGTTYDCELERVFLNFDGEERIVASAHDISERKAAERALYRTQTALNTAADSVIWVNPDGRICYANDETCRRLLYSRETLQTLTVADINADLESVDKFREQFWPRIQKDKRLTLQMNHQRHDGTIFPVEIVTHHIEFEGEEFACSFIRDITERLSAEKELEEAKSRLELAIAGGNVGLWNWAIKTGDVQFSKEWHQQLGESPGAFTKLEDWESRLHPDDADQAKGTVGRVLSECVPTYQSTFRMQHRNGSYRWILAQARLSFDSNGQPERMVGTHVDVTELQETRAKLESLVQLLGVTDGAWNWDLSTDSVDYSARFRELLGFAANDYRGFPNELTSLKKQIHPDDTSDFWNQLQDHLKNDTSMDIEIRMRRTDGAYRWFRVRAAALKDEAGNATRMAGSIYDVTDRKRIELQLRESNADLEQFAYVASHDLREPLRAVGGFCQLLQRRYDDSLDEMARGYIAKAVDGASRMTHLIDDLLEYSRVGNDKRSFRQIKLQDAVETALEQTTVSIEESGAQITVGDLPTVTGDPQMMAQLFQNLISNAIKFHQQNIPPVIHVSAARNGPFWDISVEDNGMGIKPEYIEQTFTIFKRLHRREQIPGTGIGLAICKRIAERHNGSVAVSSIPDKGSIFTLSLPAQETRHV